MTATSAAPTLGDSWNRQLADNTDSIAPEPMAQGRRYAPSSLATLDLPQRKVLMVVEDAMVALDLQRLLHEAGYRVVGPASTVAEVQRLLERGDIDCAILDRDLDRRAPLPIADLLAFAEVPFVYLTTRFLAPVPVWHRHRPVVEKPFNREALLGAVEKAMAKSGGVADDRHWHGGLVVPWTRVYPPL
jgi:DNA-binding response OmpR family regulator